MSDIEYLEEERKKLWLEMHEQKKIIDSVQEKLSEVISKTPEDVAEAKQNSKKTSEYKNKTQDTFFQAQNIKQEIKQLLEYLEPKIDEIKRIAEDIEKAYSDTTIQQDEIAQISDSIKEKNTNFLEQLTEINEAFTTCSSYLSKAKEISTKLTEEEENCASLEKKVISIHQRTLSKYNEIKDLYDETFGYDTENEETGKTGHVEGLKEELEKTYETLENSFKKLKLDFEAIKKEQEDVFNHSIEENQKKYNELHKYVESLLPGAMTAGLSSAYYDKRIAEEEERDKSDKTFHKSIKFLTVISLLPFGLSAYLLFGKGFDIQTVINDMPRIVMATFPLYAPALWVAYSSNRKSNLSKRLIEEYTHKEALSKTFEGLSKQIEDLDDDKSSQDLKVKLLYSIVSMSSDNPGALIKGYNKSDHPFMDIIDKSVNLTNSLEKMSNIPGIGHIVNSVLEVIEPRQEQKITTGINANKAMNEKSTNV